MAGSQPFSTRKSFGLGELERELVLGQRAADAARRRSTIVLISSFVSLWKTMTSSMRLRNSGRKTFLSSPVTRFFMSS